MRVKNGDKIFTSGKEGIFIPGIPIGEAKIVKNKIKVLLFSDLSQITFVNVTFTEWGNDTFRKVSFFRLCDIIKRSHFRKSGLLRNLPIIIACPHPQWSTRATMKSDFIVLGGS